jgi:hypothetical protein
MYCCCCCLKGYCRFPSARPTSKVHSPTENPILTTQAPCNSDPISSKPEITQRRSSISLSIYPENRKTHRYPTTTTQPRSCYHDDLFAIYYPHDDLVEQDLVFSLEGVVGSRSILGERSDLHHHFACGMDVQARVV